MATCEGNHVSKRIRQACEGGKALIEIKRSCNSSIRNDLEKRQITFGAFTIRITEADYTAFDWLLRDKKLKAADLLQDLIDAGMEYYLDEYTDPEGKE